MMNSRFANANRILITFLMQLGDLVLLTPCLQVLRKNIPNAEITLLIDEKLREIVQYNPDIDCCLTIDRKGRDNNIPALWRYSKKLRELNFDVALNLNPSERCSFLCAFSGARYITGDTARIFQPWFDQVLPLNRHLHAADMYIDILSRLGANDLSQQGLKIVPGSENDAAAQLFYQQQNINHGETVVGFNIGSAAAAKRWQTEKFAAVADQLVEQYGVRIVFFGGSGDIDMVRQTVQQMTQPAVIASGQFTLGQLAAALRRCKLLITTDSGPMHVAIAQHVPVVALYGPSHEEWYGPYTKQAIVVRAATHCDGCATRMRHTCPTNDCMKDITVEQVVQAAKRFLTT